MYTETTATRKIFSLRKRIRAVCGGTSASKTVSILIYLIDKAQSTENLSISVVSESFPHLKRGAIRDFMSIMVQHKYFQEKSWNATDKIYTFSTGSFIEFFSADQPDKVRGPRRNILFINECNNVPYETFDQLEIRTLDEIWLDWNPTNEFWFYDQVKHRDDVDFITLTYKDNEALDERLVRTIESRKENKNWWKVYGLGELGDVESKVYRDWQIIDDIPHEARLERYGLDFGYSQDPTAIVAVYYYNGGYIFDEIIYQKEMSNKQIADIFANVPKAMIIADSAEPKSIDDIKSYGVFVLPSMKGPGSVSRGVRHVQGQRVSVTKRSVNLIKEYRNYLWKTAKDGRVIDVPEGGFDHCMDALRYAMESLKPKHTEERQPTHYERIIASMTKTNHYVDPELGDYY